MDEAEKIYRQKVFKTGALSIGICLFIAYWYSTQGVAADGGYSELLGGCLTIGDVHIYPPYKYYFWQQDKILQSTMSEVIRSYAAFPYLGFVVGGLFTYACAKGLKKETSHGSAAFATAKEIDESGLGMYDEKPVIEKRKIFGITYNKKVRKIKKIRRGGGSKSVQQTFDATRRSGTYIVDSADEKWQGCQHDNSDGIGVETLNFFL